MPDHDLLLQPFLDHLAFGKRYSPHTVVSYRTDLEQFFLFLEGTFDSPPLPGITGGMVRTWLAGLKDDGMAAKSINRKISSLSSFFKFQLKAGAIKQSPLATVTGPKAGKRLPSYVEEKDLQTLFSHVEFEDNWDGKTARLALRLFYATGMRLAELISLKNSSLDSANGQVKVVGKGNKERIIPVSQELAEELRAYMAAKEADMPSAVLQLFVNGHGKALQPRAVYTFVNKYLSLITTVRKKSPHILRHSFATHLMSHGADLNAVKELLGHSSLAATQVYTHNNIEQLKEVFKKAHPKSGH